jgi:hypothetical protein
MRDTRTSAGGASRCGMRDARNSPQTTASSWVTSRIDALRSDEGGSLYACPQRTEAASERRSYSLVRKNDPGEVSEVHGRPFSPDRPMLCLLYRFRCALHVSSSPTRCTDRHDVTR